MGKWGFPTVMILVGLLMTYHGISAISGRKRCWYFGYPTYRSRAINTFGLCIGIWGLIFGTIFALDISLKNNIFSLAVGWILFLGPPIIGFILLLLQPSFVTPKWAQKLEQEYGKNFVLFLEGEVKKTGCNEQQIRTDEGLKKWLAEMYEKYQRYLLSQ